MTSVMWFRRDLRLGDHPALNAATSDGPVVPLFIVDPNLIDDSMRSCRLAASLKALDASIGGALVVRTGDPADVVAQVAQESGARSVHISADFAPYGRARDARAEAALTAQGSALVATGSPYAVAPGRVRKPDGTPYRVYTPFYRAWLDHGWRDPAPAVKADWLALPSDGRADLPPAADVPGPIGEVAALETWEQFATSALADYAKARDLPAEPGTSRLSAALRFGEIHPRTLLATLAATGPDDADGAHAYQREIAFREFYADVLFHHPDSLHTSLDRRFDTALEYRTGSQADADFAAWCAGLTGYPIVDAGMRQLREQGWMHNRVRMIVASFLVKDLHLPWWRGAAWFMARLADGDPASNSQGWQWTAGCGTDASPFYRVFNPVSQGKKFDPKGDYVRRFVPELRALTGATAHEPWLAPLLAPDYPAPIVDHAVERRVALDRFAAMKAAAAN